MGLTTTFIGGSVAGAGPGYSYHLLDRFNTAESAPIASPRTCEPGPGTLTMVDVETDKASIASGKYTFAAQATAVWGELGFNGVDARTRAAGLMLLIDINLTTWEECGIGWYTSAAVVDPDSAEAQIQANTADGQLDLDGTTLGIWTGLSVSTDYKLAIVLRTTGAYLFGHDGTNWLLLYIWGSGATATLYPMFANLDGAGSLDNFTVPKQLWLPTPLAYDTFTRAYSSTLGSTETTGPDGQACGALAWAEAVGDWSIASNKLQSPAANSVSHYAIVDTGEADVVLECTSQISAIDGYNVFGVAVRYVDTSNQYDVVLYNSDSVLRIGERDDGAFTTRSTASVVMSAATDYTIKVACNGTTITAWVNDGDRVNYSSDTMPNTTATKFGGRHYTTGSNVQKISKLHICPRTHANFPSV